MSAMNGFRLAGDAFHVIAIVILLVKLIWTRSCAGISARSQILFAMVYTARYLDLGYTFSMYNSIMKMMYIASSFIIVFLITCVFSATYQHKKDAFLTEFLVIPCFMIATYSAYELTAVEILWTFSMYLEAVAILPQFHMICKKKQMDRSLFFYLVALAAYRGFYVFNWLYRYYTEEHFDLIADGAGIVYTFMYIFFGAEIIFKGIKITDEERGTLLRNNIFFVSNNGPLEERLNLHDELDIEKSNMFKQSEVEKA